MPDKTSVSVVFRIVRDEGMQELAAAGQLHRLVEGWAVTCRIAGPAQDSGTDAKPSEMTLIVRDREIRMRRNGAVSQEQVFRVGEWRQGTIGTLYGDMPAEAWTHRIRAGLSPAGGTVEWEYDMKTAGTELGRCSITLDIREEQTK